MKPFISAEAQDYESCLSYSSKIIETPAGVIEFADRGDGPVLLSVHGGPGGYDQGLAVGECFRLNGFRIISVSRPGYLGTPLSSGPTLEAQAKLLASLIDTLGLGRVAVVGASAGGPPSYMLAQLYPEKVSALIQIDSVSMRYTKADEISKFEEVLYLSKPGVWLMDYFMRHFPAATVKSFLETESTLEAHDLGDRVRYVVRDPAKMAMLQVLSATMCRDYDRRKQGVLSDLENMKSFDRLPLDKISCPTLVMHGTDDGDVPPEQAVYAAEAVYGAELYWIEKGSHVSFWLADAAEDAQKYAVRWLWKHVS